MTLEDDPCIGWDDGTTCRFWHGLHGCKKPSRHPGDHICYCGQRLTRTDDRTRT